MEITRTDLTPGEITLIITGQLDFMVRKDFQAAIQEALTTEPTHLILNLSQVSFIDCAAVGILVGAKQDPANAQITLSLRTAPGRVSDVLKFLNVDKIFSVPTPTHMT